MCCCEKPVVNGEPGYKWQPNDAPMVRQPNPPDLRDPEYLIYDEPGRCGGADSHCHHFRVTVDHGRVYLLVRHGGGDERMEFGWKSTTLPALAALDSNGRYWLLCSAFHGMKNAVRTARETERVDWESVA